MAVATEDASEAAEEEQLKKSREERVAEVRRATGLADGGEVGGGVHVLGAQERLVQPVRVAEGRGGGVEPAEEGEARTARS